MWEKMHLYFLLNVSFSPFNLLTQNNHYIHTSSMHLPVPKTWAVHGAKGGVSSLLDHVLGPEVLELLAQMALCLLEDLHGPLLLVQPSKGELQLQGLFSKLKGSQCAGKMWELKRVGRVSLACMHGPLQYGPEPWVRREECGQRPGTISSC